MALKPITLEEIKRLEDDLADIAGQVRKMRQEWEDLKAKEVDLEIEKAVGFVEYLKTTWVHRCYAQFRQSVVRKSVSETRERIKSQRDKSAK